MHMLAAAEKSRLQDLLGRILRIGTAGYGRADRRGLIVANATGYLASFSSLVYALIYAIA